MFWEKFINFINIFIAPTEYFANLKKQPNWLIPFFIITILIVIIGYLSLPFKQEVMLSTLSAQLGEARAQETLSNASRFALVGLLFTPIPLLIKWVVVAAMLYYASILFDAQTINFKMVFSVVVHAELILLCMGIINILILEIKGINALKDLTDLQTIVGLEYFIHNKTNHTYLFTFLSNYNTFTVWYIMVLTIGLAVVSQLEKWKSAIIVSLVWLFGVGFQVSVAYLSANLQTMMGK